LQKAPDILSAFDPISLKEMDSVKLMDRTDTKFIFHRSRLEEILAALRPNYRVLQIQGHTISRYKTLYYDTKNFNLYLSHHNGRLNRYKIRHRTYVESDLGFLEVKLKNNKERTIKQRIKKKETPMEWEADTLGFLSEKTPFDPTHLIPALWVNYSRITLVNRNGAERVTIDLGLEFIKKGVVKSYDDLAIAEVKQDKKVASPFLKLMKELHIREGSISKYCLGVTALVDTVKKNNFKPKLLHLKHVLHATNHIAANSR